MRSYLLALITAACSVGSCASPATSNMGLGDAGRPGQSVPDCGAGDLRGQRGLETPDLEPPVEYGITLSVKANLPDLMMPGDMSKVAMLPDLAAPLDMTPLPDLFTPDQAGLSDLMCVPRHQCDPLPDNDGDEGPCGCGVQCFDCEFFTESSNYFLALCGTCGPTGIKRAVRGKGEYFHTIPQ